MSVNRRTLPLSQLRAFEAAARHCSFKRAAEELAVTPAAVSHQVRDLEALLGVALFERRVRQVVPTPVAMQLLPVLQRGFDAFGEALEALREQGDGGSVTLSCTPAFASQWLLPRLADFHARCPDTDLRIHASEAPLDLSRSASLAIRYGMGPYPELEAEVLAEDAFALVASPRLALTGYEDLKVVRHIVFDWHCSTLGLPSWQHWCQVAGLTQADLGASLSFSDESHAIQAAVAGQGVALLSLTLVKAELERGVLQVPFGPRLPGLRYQLVRHHRFAGHAALEEVAAWLREEFARDFGGGSEAILDRPAHH
jgi:LysR family glycine cleavage system transcriptional activator